MPGIFGKFEKTTTKSYSGYGGYSYRYNETTVNYAAKYSLIGIGGALMTGNALIGIIRPTLYPFHKQFDTFYDIDNEARWPAGGNLK